MTMSFDQYHNLSQRIRQFFEISGEFESAFTLGDLNLRITSKPNDTLRIPEFILLIEMQHSITDMTEKDWEDYDFLIRILNVVFNKINVYQVDNSYFQHGKVRIYVFIDEESGLV